VEKGWPVKILHVVGARPNFMLVLSRRVELVETLSLVLSSSKGSEGFVATNIQKEGQMAVENELDLEAMDTWYTTHFEELVMKFAGKAIAVVADEIVAVADTEKEADRLAWERNPDAVPLVLAIPTEEELICLL